MPWLILGAETGARAGHMKTGSQAVPCQWIAAEDILSSLAPVILTCSQVELCYMTELPEKIQKRSSGQGCPASLADFKGWSILPLYVPSSSLHYSLRWIDKHTLQGSPQRKPPASNCPKHSFRGSPYCQASSMTTPQSARGQRIGSRSDLDGALR
jgi:hypothetical protein